MVLPIILFFHVSFASPEDDSMYRYNALENRNFLTATTDTTDNNLVKKSPKNNTVIDTNIEKLEEVIKYQNRSIEESDNAIAAIENAGKLKKFLVGNKLGVLKYQLVQMKGQNTILMALASDVEDITTENKIKEQINILKLQQEKVENVILQQENKFSLFGWLVASL